MNGPSHYREAERLLRVSMLTDDEAESGYEGSIAAAQVHATLALAAATAYPAINDYCGDEGGDAREWAKATEPVKVGD